VERDYIIDELRKSGVIDAINSIKAGQLLAGERVNHYVTDGEDGREPGGGSLTRRNFPALFSRLVNVRLARGPCRVCLASSSDQ
jgi:hypothetical protein